MTKDDYTLVLYSKESDIERVIYSSNAPILKFNLLSSGELLVASYNGKIDHICPTEDNDEKYETMTSVCVCYMHHEFGAGHGHHHHHAHNHDDESEDDNAQGHDK